MTTNLRIGIVGGSIAGGSAAILLLRAEHDVNVFERSTGTLVGRGGSIATTSAVLNAEMKEDATVPLQIEDGSEAVFALVLFADGYQSLGRQILFPDVALSY